ncbi:MAG: hypothetical protein ABJP48_07445 [Erythrobacter sp.]
MDSDLLIIFPGILVGLVIIGVSINGIASKFINYKKWDRQQRDKAPDSPGNELAMRTDVIEERLQVLERIATDPEQNLAKEIEDLRNITTAESTRA